MRVFLFVPCFIDQFFPNVALSATRVLEHLGCEIVFPVDQTCCGQPAFNSGYVEEARVVAMHEANAFIRFGANVNNTHDDSFNRNNDYIVGLSGSCVAMIRNYYPGLLSELPDFSNIADRFTDRVYEFTEFISKVIGVEKFSGKLDAVVSFHDSCHGLRELGLFEEPRSLLARIKGLRLVELPYNDVCCGFGGTFSVKFPEISSAMADEKLQRLKSTGADILVSGDSSCLMHLQGRARRLSIQTRFVHIAEIMGESIR